MNKVKLINEINIRGNNEHTAEELNYKFLRDTSPPLRLIQKKYQKKKKEKLKKKDSPLLPNVSTYTQHNNACSEKQTQ